MSAIGNARCLRALVIDDEPQDVLMADDYGFSTHLVIAQITSWADAQRIMASGGAIEGADILLVDVSMEKDNDIKKASKKEGSATILPAGPIIALPFIGKRAVMSYMVYSAHMKNPDLQRHPFFLIAMGLIMARTEGLTKGNAMLSTHLSTGAGPFQLDKTIEELRLHASAAAVLWPAVKEYRERLVFRYGVRAEVTG
jgi:hypothetical protein